VELNDQRIEPISSLGQTVMEGVRSNTLNAADRPDRRRRPRLRTLGRQSRDPILSGTIAYRKVTQYESKFHSSRKAGWAHGGLLGSRTVPGVNCQERTRDELLKTLRVTAHGSAGNETAPKARDAAGKGYEELSIAV